MAAALSLGLTGCMTLVIDGGDSAPVVTRHFGLLQVSSGPASQAQVGSLAGVGFAATPLGLSLGYTSQRWAVLGPKCHAVVWVTDQRLSEATRAELRRVAGICVAEEAAAELAAAPPVSSTTKGLP